MKFWIPTSFMAAALFGCSKSDSAADAASSVSTEVPGSVASAVNALAAAYPQSLALSVFPSSETSLRLADAGPAVEDTTGADRPPEEKQKEAIERMKGEGECFDIHQMGEFKKRFDGIKCYEFDTDMNPIRLSGDTEDRYGTTTGLDGLTGSTQACLVTFTKSQVDEVVHAVDRSLAMVQGLICVEKKIATDEGRDVRKPEVDGDVISLADAINDKLPEKAPISFTKADVSAVTNDDGGVTYITEISIKNPFGKTDSITLRHTPATEEGGGEEGILTFLREPLGDAVQQAPKLQQQQQQPPQQQGQDPNASGEKYSVMTIQYTKSTTDGVDNMKAELVRAMINKKYEPLNDDGLINFDAIPKTAQNSDIHAINYVSFDINPATGEGGVSYWMNPGGNFVESARGLLFNLEADETTGLLSGCGTSGATSDVSIRMAVADSSKTLAPTRFWHPQGNSNVSPNKDDRYQGSEGNKVTKQCVTQTSAGSYKIDTAKTTHARGYDVVDGTDSAVRAPARPPEPKLPPPPPKS